MGETTHIRIDFGLKEELDTLKEKLGVKTYNDLLKLLIENKKKEILESEIRKLKLYLQSLDSRMAWIDTKAKQLKEQVESKRKWVETKIKALEEELEKLKKEEELESKKKEEKVQVVQYINWNAISSIKQDIIFELYKYFLAKFYSKEELEKINAIELFEKFQIGGEPAILEDLKKNYDKYRNMDIFGLTKIIDGLFERLKQTVQTSQSQENKQ